MTTNNPQGLKINKPGTYTEEEMKAAFPDVDPAFVPLGNRVLVQLRNLDYRQSYLVRGMKKQVRWDRCGIYFVIHEAPSELRFVQEF